MISSLRTRIMLLVMLAVIPALGLLIYSANEQRSLAAQNAQDNALRLVRLVASDQEQIINNA